MFYVIGLGIMVYGAYEEKASYLLLGFGLLILDTILINNAGPGTTLDGDSSGGNSSVTGSSGLPGTGLPNAFGL